MKQRHKAIRKCRNRDNFVIIPLLKNLEKRNNCHCFGLFFRMIDHQVLEVHLCMNQKEDENRLQVGVSLYGKFIQFYVNLGILTEHGMLQ